MKWVIGVVAVLVVVCGGLCASGGLFWYAQQGSDEVALPDAFPVEPPQVEPVPAPPPVEPPPAAPPPVEPPPVAPPATPPAAPPPVAPAPTPTPTPTPAPTTSSTSSSSSSSSKSSTSSSSSSSTTKAPASSTTTSTKSSTTKTTTPAPAPASTSTTSSSSSSKSTAEEPDVELPAADETVAVGFVLPSGAKWDDLKVSVDGKSLGRRPLRTRVTPGMHSFSFRGEEIDITCSIEVGTSGRTIIIDQKKKSCPGKAS